MNGKPKIDAVAFGLKSLLNDVKFSISESPFVSYIPWK